MVRKIVLNILICFLLDLVCGLHMNVAVLALQLALIIALQFLFEIRFSK